MGNVFKSSLVPSSSGGGNTIDYSTREQDTGMKWIDGKKIYQKTSSISITAKNTNLSINDITNVDKIISVEGSIYISDTDQVLLNYYMEGTGSDIIGFYNGKFYVRCAFDNRINKTAIVTARYTKK